MENIKEKFEFEVISEYEGMRLDKYLSEQIEDATRSYLEKLIDNNFVKVNSKIINKNGRKLKLGEKIEKNILDKVTMNDVEKDKLIEGLKRNAFSLSNTAKDLGMSRTTLWRKLKKFNIIIE